MKYATSRQQETFQHKKYAQNLTYMNWKKLKAKCVSNLILKLD